MDWNTDESSVAEDAPESFYDDLVRASADERGDAVARRLVGERHVGAALIHAAVDGGVDLVLSKGGDRFLVQCKQWKAFKVGVTVVRELYGVMAARGAAGGFVVTSGRFTGEAAAFASGRNIRLIDGPTLLQLIRQGSSVAQPTVEPQCGEPAPSPSPVSDVPPCPVCTKAMVRRVAKRGASTGNAFWGCLAYPVCKGTRPL